MLIILLAGCSQQTGEVIEGVTQTGFYDDLDMNNNHIINAGHINGTNLNGSLNCSNIANAASDLCTIVDTNTQLSNSTVVTIIDNQYPLLDTNVSDDFDGAFSSLTGVNATLADNYDNDTLYTNTSPITQSGEVFGLAACGDSQLYKYNSTSGTWECRADETGAGGTVTGSGSGNVITKWTGSSSIGDSIMTETGTLISVAGDLSATVLSGSLNCSNIVNATSDLCSLVDTDTDTTYNAGEIYINEVTNVFSLNETVLNTTIDARDTDTNTQLSNSTVEQIILNQDTYVKNTGDEMTVGLNITGELDINADNNHIRLNETDGASSFWDFFVNLGNIIFRDSSGNNVFTLEPGAPNNGFTYTAAGNLVLTPGEFKADTWTNVSITESQISDLSHTVDTNETTRINTLIGTDCTGTRKVVGINATGGIVCADDIDTDTNTQLSNATVVTIINNQYPNLDTDSTNDLTTATTFSNSGGEVSVTGTYNALVLALLSNVVGDNELNYTQVTLSDFINDAGFITSDTNETTRFNNLINTNCIAGQVVIGINATGGVECVDDIDTDTNTQLSNATVQQIITNQDAYLLNTGDTGTDYVFKNVSTQNTTVAQGYYVGLRKVMDTNSTHTRIYGPTATIHIG